MSIPCNMNMLHFILKSKVLYSYMTTELIINKYGMHKSTTMICAFVHMWTMQTYIHLKKKLVEYLIFKGNKFRVKEERMRRGKRKKGENKHNINKRLKHGFNPGIINYEHNQCSLNFEKEFNH